MPSYSSMMPAAALLIAVAAPAWAQIDPGAAATYVRASNTSRRFAAILAFVPSV